MADTASLPQWLVEPGLTPYADALAAMEAHVAAAEQMVIGESGDHGANMTEMHFSICASAGCVSASIQESLPPTAFTSGDTAAFGMFEHEGGAGRAVSPEYRPPITG